VVLAILIAVGVVGITRLNQLDDITQQMADKDFKKTDYLYQALVYTRANATRATELVATTEKALIATANSSMKANAEKVSDAMAKVEPLLHTEAGKALFAQITKNRAAYRDRLGVWRTTPGLCGVEHQYRGIAGRATKIGH
jgi:methyl-accepting chemotaxis protein